MNHSTISHQLALCRPLEEQEQVGETDYFIEDGEFVERDENDEIDERFTHTTSVIISDFIFEMSWRKSKSIILTYFAY